MAILNWAETYQKVTDHLNNNGDKTGLYFTGDGQIYTHEKEYFSPKNEQLIKAVAGIISTDQIKALNYKGSVIGLKETSLYPQTGIESNGTKVYDIDIKTGDVFIVKNTIGSYEPGDMLIVDSITGKDGDNEGTVKWSAILYNIQGNPVKINGKDVIIYGLEVPPTMYIPTTKGGEGDLLKSTEKGLDWVSPKTLNVSKGLSGSWSLTNGGAIEGTTFTTTTMGMVPAPGTDKANGAFYLGGNGEWCKANDMTNTWRPISVGSTSVDLANSLNFEGGNGIVVSPATSGSITTVTVSLDWNVLK